MNIGVNHIRILIWIFYILIYYSFLTHYFNHFYIISSHYSKK